MPKIRVLVRGFRSREEAIVWAKSYVAKCLAEGMPRTFIVCQNEGPNSFTAHVYKDG